MRRVHLDAVGGVAGDMFVAGMLDALPELRDRVLADVRAMLPASAGTADLAQGVSGGVRVLRFNVTLHDHAAAHHHHHHHHHRHHDGAGHAGRRDTSYAGIMGRIAGAALAEGTARHAGAILTILGEAEAHIHGVPLADVHFHELADWDSVADVVAAGSVVAALGDAVWSVSELPRGGGLVRTQHGMLPVPAPATAAILAGFAWRDDGIPGERVTPTGAAILRHLRNVSGGSDGSSPAPAGILVANGTGAGTRDIAGMPNILRALVFDEAPEPALRARVAVVSFDIDDMTGEELAEAADRIRRHAGVLDVSMSMAIGKKGRPLMCFSVLAREEALESLRIVCLKQTSTLGLRWRIEERMVLPRDERRGAVVRVKAATRPDGSVTMKAESDDLREARDLADRRRRQRHAETEAAEQFVRRDATEAGGVS